MYIGSSLLQLNSKATWILNREKELWFLRLEILTVLFQKIESSGMLCHVVG